jgi:hypothetical protein
MNWSKWKPEIAIQWGSISLTSKAATPFFPLSPSLTALLRSFQYPYYMQRGIIYMNENYLHGPYSL